MRFLPPRHRARKCTKTLCLFDWTGGLEAEDQEAVTFRSECSRAAKRIARRYGLPDATARLVAFHAGFQSEAVQ